MKIQFEKIVFWAFGILISSLIISCDLFRDNSTQTLFTKLSNTQTGIDFSNNLEYTNSLHPFIVRNFYNGGGVAVGDINNDGLADIFFTGNRVPNKLYLNKGDFQFEDISEKAGIFSEGLWYTGVTFVDINGDGWLDIYVCQAEDYLVGWRGNELYINNKDLTFSEQTEEYGLMFDGFSTQSVFFDIDNDSDLDCFLLSNSKNPVVESIPPKDQRYKWENDGNKLFLNEGNHFVDITKQSGIFASNIGLGLGVSISDINKDGWPDIYVSNDYFERDYLYINNRNQTFTECLEKYIQELSMFSMGADIADINNDTYPEIYVTDMLPEKESRLKAKTSFDSWDKYNSLIEKGYHKQFIRNVLQLNRGPVKNENGENEFYFSDISRLAKVHATDWSWGALIADFNNDGNKDIFVANGMYKDVTDQDFIQFIANDPVSFYNHDWKSILDKLPSEPLSNYIFENNGDLTFTNRINEWGFGTPGFSNGSAYVDLDNDGDLDIVTNNINDYAGIYRNNSDQLLSDNKYLKVILKGDGSNKFGIGVKVTAYYNNTLCFVEQFPSRGFQSCIDTQLHMGLGNALHVDSLLIEWPSGKYQIMKEVATNQTIIVEEKSAITRGDHSYKLKDNPLFSVVSSSGINFVHTEDPHIDFNNDKLIYQMLSTMGPKIAVSDVNSDGLDDVFICGAKDQAAALYIQRQDGKFKKSNLLIFEQDKEYEDTDCIFIDVDIDGDKDLFVCSGGNVYDSHSRFLENRLYMNDGKGIFTRNEDWSTDEIGANFSTVSASDFDLDGDIDLFIGERSMPGKYGYPGNGHLFANNGKGVFSDVTKMVAPDLYNIGMITAGTWIDYDLDKLPDLVVVGEYMPIKIFHNENNKLVDVTERIGLSNTNGWWNVISIGDLNNDGYIDIVVGNHGLNSRFKASAEHPISLLTGDYDNNGSVEQIVCMFNEGKQYPMVLRHDLIAVLPSLKKIILNYSEYKEKTMDQLFTKSQLSDVIKLNAYQLQTSVLINDKKGGFELKPLPIEAQLSPIYGILIHDFDKDGNNDILLGGNFYESKPEVGIYSADYGQLLIGNGKGNFKSVAPYYSGVLISGAVRDFKLVNSKRQLVLAARNNGSVEVMELNNK